MTDVLIVGAGSAGSVLAERLSADPGCRVTVIETGPGRRDATVQELTDDAFVLPIGPNSPVIRRYRTLLTDDPPLAADIVRGACVGGSGAVNGCYFWRALPQDFDAVPGWSWPAVQDHYRAVEDRIPAHPTSGFSHSTEQFVAAADSAGHRAGISVVPLNIAGGRRLGPGAMFLEPALDRPNLTVLTGCRVSRVLFEGNRAVGVAIVGPEGARMLSADRLVLAAGAIGTAQLLMLSGIGPGEHLRTCGIATIADLPVGLHCWDHPERAISTGWTPAGHSPVLEVVLNHEDLEIRPYTTGFGAPSPSIGVALMRPRSRGRVMLASADPTVQPRIEHRYDSEPADVVALRRGCELVRDMIGGRTALREPVWSTSQHLAGTAPMGTDGHAVVDPQLRVLGMENLWVADGSVLPAPLGRGPHATIAMIGHRAAEFVSP